MQKFITLVVAAVAVALSLSAAQEAGEVTVQTAQHEEIGTYLTDAEGRSLYLFTRDSENTSTCTDQCAENWPPLLVEGEPMAGQGVATSLLGTTERDDGSTQVTYNGWPLYYFARDESPGEIAGQGVGDPWYLISPFGAARQPRRPAEAAAQPAEAAGEETEDDAAEDAGQVDADLMAQGRSTYSSTCASCHGRQGGGGAGPSLVGNDVLGNSARTIRQILYGGQFMPAFADRLNDEQVAAVATFIRNSWDNDFGGVTPEEVSEQRR
jgi:predicted lipoprotein with Yx(FWY)xxD motif/cytochrome c2